MPSIDFAQAVSATVAFPSAPGPNATVTLGTTVTGSLLVAFYASFDNPSANLNAPVVLTDTAGNIWRQYGGTSFDPNVSGSWLRAFYCISNLGGAPVVTATVTNSSWIQVSLAVAEFTRPITLAQYASDQGNVNTDAAGNVLTPRIALPGPGLMVSCYESNRTDMALDPGTFIAMPAQLGTGCNIVWAYALNPQGATRCSWTRSPAGTTRGGTQIVAFLDTAGFEARPRKLVGGQGAVW
jgi:hypothetical protein